MTYPDFMRKALFFISGSPGADSIFPPRMFFPQHFDQRGHRDWQGALAPPLVGQRHRHRQSENN
jgi:hypothetical protein